MRERTSEKEHKKRSDAARPTTKSRIHKNAKKAMIASSFLHSNGFGLDFPVFSLTLTFSYAPSHLPIYCTKICTVLCSKKYIENVKQKPADLSLHEQDFK